MNILVTGAAGFIGSNLIEKLIDDGHQLIGVDNFDPFYDKKIKEQNLTQSFNSKNFVFENFDITNFDIFEEVFKKHKIDSIIHLAAKAGVRPSIQTPGDYYKSKPAWNP